MPEHSRVKSSTINGFSYDPSTQHLEVTFKSGETYSYHNVPAEKYLGWCESESYGKYFHQNIRNQYTTVKHGQEVKK